MRNLLRRIVGQTGDLEHDEGDETCIYAVGDIHGHADLLSEICARIGPALREKGLIFTGIDVIDGWLTEINVTSPTGIQELERFDGINAAALIWDAVERRLAAR